MSTYVVRYKATVRGVLEIEADSREAALEIAHATGYDPTTSEQSDFDIISVRETPTSRT